ncbi:MAG: tRNA lysidine(34) synthetase TilS [Bdellovibrionota bacterium]
MLEFELFRSFADQLRGKKILIACSGGRDSMALVEFLKSIHVRSGFEFGIAYVHHGPSNDLAVSTYRDRARDFVAERASELSLTFHDLKSQTKLKSEADFRKFRMISLEETRSNYKYDLVATGHHADDLNETRLIRLIRGTGPQGLVAMREISQKIFRPFLKQPASVVHAYVDQKKIRFIEDPTNQEDIYLRNWIRNVWLPALESKRTGAKNSLMRSLEAVSSEIDRIQSEVSSFVPLERASFEKMNSAGRRKIVAQSLRQAGGEGYTMRHVNEVVKRLESVARSGQRHLKFTVSRTEWAVEPREITVRLAQDPEN